MSLVLLIGAALLVTSFARLRSQQPGFDPSHIFIAGVSLPPSRYPDIGSRGRFWLRLTEELSNAPGVTRATLSSQPPLGGGFTRAPYALNEGAVAPLNERPLGLTMSVTPGYFATLGIPTLAGRDFTERDTHEAPLVAVVSTATSRKLGGSQGLLGRRIIMGSQGGGEVMEVIGIVDDVRAQSLAATSDVEFYRPVMQRQRPFMRMMVKTAGDPAAFEATARSVLSRLDRTLPLTGITTHSALVERSLAQQRLLVRPAGRVRVARGRAVCRGDLRRGRVVRQPADVQIGVRLALGASRREVIGVVLRQSLVPVGVGLCLGLIGAVGLGRFVQGLLFQVLPFDPLTLGAGVVILAIVAGIACVLPAGRAARIDPVTALRGE